MLLVRLIRSNALILGSLTVFLGSILAISWISDPPQFANFLIGNRPGTVAYQLPETIFQNQPFNLSININTNKQAANAVGLYLRFDPKKLQVVDLDTSQSFCQFYPEKKYDNQLGSISLACGSPHPGVTGTSTILKLQLIPLTSGTITLTLDPRSQILLSDGKGTNVLLEHPQLPINVRTHL